MHAHTASIVVIVIVIASRRQVVVVVEANETLMCDDNMWLTCDKFKKIVNLIELYYNLYN